MINQFSIGLTALRSAQFGLAVTGQNIANANTPGYHRQMAHLVSRPSILFGDLEFGTGVEVNHIRRLQSRVVEQALTESITARADINVRLDTSRQFESMFLPGPGSITDRIGSLFNGLEELSSQPFDPSARRAFVATAVDFTNSLRGLTEDLDFAKREVDAQIRDVVSTVNVLTREVVDLNLQIREAKAAGVQPNNLLDQRDALVNELAQYLDVRLDRENDTVLLADGHILAGQNYPRELGIAEGEGGIFLVQGADSDPISTRGGQLAGLFATRNEIIPNLNGHLDEIARGFIAVVDHQHSQGVGIDGRFDRLIANRPVEDTTLTFDQLDTVLPVGQGSLFVSVVNKASGDRQLVEIAVDPTTDTLEGLATKLSAIDHLQAVTNAETGQLTIVAEPGFEFDFTGAPESLPDTAGLSGTAIPRLSGFYSGPQNENLNFVFLGDGEIGVTEGLKLQVQDEFGNEIETVDIGKGYAPGVPIQLSNGIELQFGAGSAVAGESFATQAVANADTAGILTALGLNTFFAGNDARTLQVDANLINNPDRLATSITGEAGDASNLSRIIARRTLTILDGERTVEQFASGFVADIGSDVVGLARASDSLDLLGESLVAQQSGFSGVDPNEEAVHMLEFQRSFQAAARYISAIDQTTQELLLILG